MGDLFGDLYRQNEWATLQVLAACRELSDEQLDATTIGTFGSIRETLVHCLRAEPGYVTQIGGTYEGPSFPAGGVFPGFDMLEAVAKATTPAFIERAAAVDGEPFSFRSPENEDIDAAVVLAQALNHSTDHRSQICVILTTLGVPAPSLDGWTWGEQTGRIRAL